MNHTRFFFDRCMPLRLARMIAVWVPTHQILHHDDDLRFDPTTEDVEWIRTVGNDHPPWVVISGDSKILKRPLEREALRNANLTFFCLSDHWPKMPINEQAWKFLKVWPDILVASDCTVPSIFRVYFGKSMKVEEVKKTSEA
jgi:hypothetical protein